MFLEAGDTCRTHFNVAIYEVKHKEKEKMRNISHTEKAFYEKPIQKYKIRRKNGYSKSKVAEFHKSFRG